MSVLTRKILPSFFGIATIGWIIGGTIWFDKQSSKQNANLFSKTPISYNTTVPKSDILPSNICFNSGSAVPIYYNKNIVDLRNTANFLIKNDRQSLLLTGLSDSEENSENSATNLGFARAEAVKSTLINFGAPNNSLDIKSEVKPQLVNNNRVCDAVKIAFVENVEGHFQALNLCFKPNKFRFTETTELNSYFNDLQIFLQKNPKTKLKIAAFGSDTEGSKIAESRLQFLTELLKTKQFNLGQLVFESKKASLNSAPIVQTENLTQQRIEIRMLTP